MTLILERLPAGQKIADENGFPTPFFKRWSDLRDQEIETIVNAQGGLIAAIAAAQDAAATANTAAATANAAATTVTAAQAIADSYVTGLTLSAADVGANVTITISAHTRVYGDGASVAVTGGTVTGVPYSTVARVYYDQPSRAGGAVTYQWTSSLATAAQAGDRHSVGAVTTPAAAGAPATGNPVLPPGTAIP